MFKHLIKVNQSYCLHFKEAMTYSWHAQKASWYFLLHAFYPDAHEISGSTVIKELSKEIQLKIDGHKKDQQN
jgi:hypothetical protein